MVAGADAAVLGRAVDLAEAADTDGLAEVDVAGDGGGAHVEPVNVLGRELLGGTGLDDVDPTGNGQLALTLQERSIGVDELLRLSREKKGPISNDSVIRSLSTPSRLLHCSSHVIVVGRLPPSFP